MTDEHGSTDDGGLDDRLEVLDLGVLSDDVAPSHAQWRSIVADAGHRRSRRTWALSAAAAVVLIAIAATLVLARTDESDLAAGGGPADASFVIPAASATVLARSSSDTDRYSVEYRDTNGVWLLQSDPLTGSDSTVGTLTIDSEPVAVERAISTERFGTAYIGCSSYATDAQPNIDPGVTPSYGIRVMTATSVVRLLPVDPRDTTCDLDLLVGQAEPILAQLDGLRLVTADQLRDFLGPLDDPEDPPATADPNPPTSITTTVPGNEPAPPADDRAQIEDAVRNFDQPGADGTWPYLEDGVTLADEYTAREEAGSAAVGMTEEDKAGKTHTITSLTFASPDEADVAMTIAVTLQGRRSTYQHTARMLRQDGHWVVSRDSYFVISAVACGSQSYRYAYPADCG